MRVCSLRLVLLFALRYEREGRAQTMDLLRRLEARGLLHAQLGLARTLLSHAGAERRTADLFSDRTFSSRFATLAKQSLRVRLLFTAPRLVSLVGMEGQVMGAGITPSSDGYSSGFSKSREAVKNTLQCC